MALVRKKGGYGRPQPNPTQPDATVSAARGGRSECRNRRKAIDAVVNRRKKLLLVERPGWGKSIVYFIATRALREHHGGPR